MAIPRSEEEFYGRVSLWHKLSQDWTVVGNVNANLAGQGSALDGKDIRPGSGVALDYRPTSHFLVSGRLGESTIGNTTYLSPSLGYSWTFAPRWQVAGSLAPTPSTPLFPLHGGPAIS